MFLRTTLAMEYKFVDDDRFRRREPCFNRSEGKALTVVHLPAGEITPTRKIAIGPQRTVLVDDVEMSARFTLQLGLQDLGGGQVEVIGREGSKQRSDLTRVNRDYQIGIKGKSRASVGNRGQTADDAISKASFFQPARDFFRPRHIQ